MKYCPKCGTSNVDEGRFCKSCGHSFSAATIKQQERGGFGSGFGRPPSSYPPYPVNSRRSDPGRIFLIIAAIVLILGGGGFAIWKYVLAKDSAGPKSELEDVDIGNHAAGSNAAGNINPAFEKFIGDWYSDNANIRRTRISAHGDLLLVETFFKDGIDSCYSAPYGNSIRCSSDFQIIIVDQNCMEGYLSIRFCKR